MPTFNWRFRLLSLSRPRRWLGELASSFRKVALTFMVYLAAAGVQAAVSKTPSPPENQGRSNDVEVRGGISDSVLTRGSRTWFFLSVSNHSPKPISVVRLRELRAEGFAIVSRCWCGAENSGCGELSRGSVPPAAPPLDCELISQRLEPGQSAVVSGQLVAESAHEKEAVIAEVSWRNDGDSLSNQFALLGETTVQGSFEHWRSSAAYDLAKDLAWPIVLLVLGAGAGLYDRSREDRRNRAAELRAQTIQTWNSMLPASHKLATKYYMPVEAAAVALLGAMEKRAYALKVANEDQQVANEEWAFYFLLLLFRRLRSLVNDKGGWYFKNRVAEELVSECLKGFRTRVLYEPVELQGKLSLAISEIDPSEKLGEFQVKLEKYGEEGERLREVRAAYAEWLTSAQCEPAVRNLKGMRILLSYEMNRPYRYWYGHSEKLNIDRETEGAVKDAAARLETENPGFIVRAEKYLANCKAGLTDLDLSE